MSIINKGILNSKTAFLRQVGNDWPTAQVVVSTTADVTEVSSNLYFTNTRVVSALIAGTAITIEANGRISANVSSSVTGAQVTSALVGANVVLNNLVVSGDLEVQGNVIQFNASVVNIEDINIVLANGAVTSAAVDGAGITIHGAQANITYRNTGDKFVINKNTDFTGNIVATGSITANTLFANNTVFGSGAGGSVTGANLISATFIQGNAWLGLYTANVVETANALYFTNARVASALIPGTAITIEANGRISANLTGIAATTATQVTSLSNFTTANLAEGTNLYFSNARARTAFTAGKGITIDSQGVVKNTGRTPLFNTDINGTGGGNVLSTMSTILTTPTIPANDRYLLKSLLVVNTSDTTSYVSGNILYATGNTAVFANQIPVAVGGLLEFVKNGQLLQPGDKINLQGFNSSSVPTSNILNAMYTYESFDNDATYIGVGQNLANSNTNITIYDSSSSFSIVESIRLVNIGTGVPRVRVYWADANNVPKVYLAYNTQIPTNSSVELLTAPKRLDVTDKLIASYDNAANASVAAFVSARLGVLYTVGSYTTTAEVSGNARAVFSTSDVDGTVLYYTIE